MVRFDGCADGITVKVYLVSVAGKVHLGGEINQVPEIDSERSSLPAGLADTTIQTNLYEVSAKGIPSGGL